MPPKVSVAMSSYNQKEFLCEAIESVLLQDYENMEIVIADDASSDGSQEMLREYDKKYPGLFKLIFQEKNLGQPENQNSAYFACTGKYMAWLDGDDLMLPGKIKKQVAVMEAHPNCVFCFHNLEVFNSGSKEGTDSQYFYDPKVNFPVQGRGVEEMIRYGGCVGRPSQMFRRSACPPHGFDTRLHAGPDYLFMIQTAINGEIKYIPEVLGRYRVHENSITKKIGEDLSYKLMHLAIIEAKYPHLWRSCRLCRARYLYTMGVQKILKHQTKEARSFLVESLRQGWVSWKWFGWFLISYMGLPVGEWGGLLSKPKYRVQ